MKNLIMLILTFTVLLVGCNSKANKSEVTVPEGITRIEVIEHLNGGGYIFIKGNVNDSKVWIAVREMPVEKGGIYYFKDPMEMRDFKSKSLNRTFESILFVSKLSKNVDGSAESNNSMPGMMSGHSKPKASAESNIDVTPLKDGETIELIVKEKAELVGKIVKFRGVVTKYNSQIMGKNWLHIQDGTSFGKTTDITVTSDQTAKVGEEIVIEGILVLDKDFGAGYLYDVIIENAKLIREKKMNN